MSRDEKIRFNTNDKGNQYWKLEDRLRLLAGASAITLVTFLFFKCLFFIVWPFVLAYVIALAIEKPVRWLSRRLWGKRTLAATVMVTIITVIFVTALGYLVYMGVTEIKAFVKNFDYYMIMVRQQCARICLNMDGWMGLKSGCCLDVAEKCITAIENGLLSDGGAQIANKVMKISMPLVASIAIVIGAIIVCIMSVVYLSNVLDKIRMWRERTVFAREVGVVTDALKQLMNVYFRIQVIIMGVNSALCIVGLMIIGNPYAIVIGLLIGLVDALPIFGTGTVLIPWAILMILCKKYMVAAVLISLYVVTYFIREIMESKCMGDRMGIAPFTMLVVIFVGFMVYGVMGFILGPISYVIIKALIGYLYGYMRHKVIRRAQMTGEVQ